MKKTNTLWLSVRLAAERERLKRVALQESTAVKVDGLIKIPLTKGQWLTIDEADWELVKGYKWALNGTVGKYYAVTSFGPRRERTTLKIHRLIMNPEIVRVFVDHIDGDGLNNSRSNLRLCSISQNCMNQKLRTTNKSGYKGVCLISRQIGSERSYCSQIGFNGKKKFIGYFATPKEAAIAYNKQAELLHGKFARLNKIEP